MARPGQRDEAILEVFADGKPHSLTEVTILVGKHIPNEVAIRNSGYYKEKSSDIATKIERGKRDIVRERLKVLTRKGLLQCIDVKQYTWIKVSNNVDKPSSVCNDTNIELLQESDFVGKSGLSRLKVYKAIKENPNIELVSLEKLVRNDFIKDPAKLTDIANDYCQKRNRKSMFVECAEEDIEDMNHLVRLFLLKVFVYDNFILSKYNKKFGKEMVLVSTKLFYRVRNCEEG